MENKEGYTHNNQLHEENFDVQRSKELFEYEMTEVKLTLAGRFKHMSSDDMQNAGADVVIRKPNLRRKEHSLLDEGEVSYFHSEIKNVNTAGLHISSLTDSSVSVVGMQKIELPRLNRTDCAVLDVGADVAMSFRTDEKVRYTHSSIDTPQVNLSFPHTGKLNAVQRDVVLLREKISVPIVKRTLTYQKGDIELGEDTPKVGNAKELKAKIPVNKTHIEIASLPALVQFNKNPKNLNDSIQIQIDTICPKVLSYMPSVSDDIPTIKFMVGETSKLKFTAIGAFDIDIESVEAPLARNIKSKKNEKMEISLNSIEKVYAEQRTIRRVPTKISVSNNRVAASKKRYTLKSHISKEVINVFHDSNIKIEMKSVERNKRVGPHINIERVEVEAHGMKCLPSMACDSVHMNIYDLIPGVLRKPVSKKISARLGEIKMDIPLIEKRTIPKSLCSIQVHTNDMKVSTISSVDDIVKKVQELSSNVLPKGLTYDELCKRCVVPVRKLDYSPVIEDIMGTLRAEYNS